MNPMDALNRRDIEMIKKSLVGMHRDSADLRAAMIALHERNSSVPSKGFILALGVVAFIGIVGLSMLRPQLEEVMQHVPMLARLTADAAPR